MTPLLRRTRLRFFAAEAAPADASAHAPAHAPAEGLALQRVARAEEFPWSAFADFPYRGQYRGRFALGHEAVIGRSGGEVAFHSWLAHGTLWIAELDLAWRLGGHDCCVYDVVTRPAFRGRGFYPAALRWIAAQPDRRAGRVWVFCDAGNEASEKGIRKSGYRERGELAAWRLRRRVVARRGRVPGVNA